MKNPTLVAQAEIQTDKKLITNPGCIEFENFVIFRIYTTQRLPERLEIWHDSYAWEIMSPNCGYRGYRWALAKIQSLLKVDTTSIGFIVSFVDANIL